MKVRITVETDLTTFIYQFFIGERSLTELESWIYSKAELESFIGSENYLELISLDFTKNSTKLDAEKIFRNSVKDADYLNWSLSQLMTKIIARPSDVHVHIEMTYELYCRGYDFLRQLGLTYGLELASPYPHLENWKGLTSLELKNLVDSFYPNIAEDAQKVIDCLQDNKIEFEESSEQSLLDGLPWNPSYLDKRSPKEKKRMGVKGLNLDKLYVRLAWKIFRIKIYSYS